MTKRAWDPGSGAAPDNRRVALPVNGEKFAGEALGWSGGRERGMSLMRALDWARRAMQYHQQQVKGVKKEGEE